MKSRALLSVTDKTGVVEFAQALAGMGAEILSTGGTARALSQAGVKVVEIADYTGQPEILDGRVKTLHPKVHGGILARRDDTRHMEALAAQKFGTIDLVCVNLYRFQETVAKPGVTLEDAIENIDIGGPAMIRSAAKNWEHVAVVTSPGQYGRVVEEMRKGGGGLPKDLRFELAAAAFALTASYDAAISRWLAAREGRKFPARLAAAWEKVDDLRYGENPHQEAAFYREPGAKSGIGAAKQLSARNSFNNISPDAALVVGPPQPAVSVIKHNNSAVARRRHACRGPGRAVQGDTVSAYGGIVAQPPVDLPREGR